LFDWAFVLGKWEGHNENESNIWFPAW
jgi:hypothetical protein